MLVTLIRPEITIPRPIPNKDAVVYCDVDLPEMSPMLLAFANRMFMLPLDAEASKKQMFFPILAVEASNKKCLGYCKVIISMKKDKFKASIDMNRHFFISSSKLVPYRAANNMPPI